ncbi:MAG: C4-type zinc ribbon domain-containing protein [Dehalococcoidia bacterium]
MSVGRHLYELQQVDLEIDALKGSLTSVESRIGDNAALSEAQKDLLSQEQSLADMLKGQRMIEDEVEDLREKIAPLEGKLYGGTIKNPKELQDFQQEVEHLKKERTKREDKILEVMVTVEAAQGNLANTRADIQKMEREWQEEQAKLMREKAKMESEMDSSNRVRKGLISRVNASSLALYENLRSTKQGLAVAKVERGMCRGCQITLPMSELQRAKLGQELVQCGSCNRILYVS